METIEIEFLASMTKQILLKNQLYNIYFNKTNNDDVMICRSLLTKQKKTIKKRLSNHHHFQSNWMSFLICLFGEYR